MQTKFPQTRYQGSKLKITNWIKENLINYKYETVLDAFGGTASISYMFKELDKTIHYNDLMNFNSIIGLALIENNDVLLNNDDIKFVLEKNKDFVYDNFIEKTFKDIYYLDSENVWLDIITQNILNVKCKIKQSMLFWCLFQACLIKRPYNLFHRKNLTIRTKEVKRTFGNKTTWDTSFEKHFLKFVKEINNAIIDNKKNNKSLNKDVLDIKNNYDLVYIDSPYIPLKGSITKYNDFYHFLNGLSDYYNWSTKIDYNSKNKKTYTEYSVWEDKKNILEAFDKIFENFQKSIIVVSYRSDGIPSIDELITLLKKYKTNIEIKQKDYQYVLSNTKNQEVLIIAS